MGSSRHIKTSLAKQMPVDLSLLGNLELRTNVVKCQAGHRYDITYKCSLQAQDVWRSFLLPGICNSRKTCGTLV